MIAITKTYKFFLSLYHRFILYDMSNTNPNTTEGTTTAPTTTVEKKEGNVTQNLANVQRQLMDIDKTEGAKAIAIYEEIGALRSSAYHNKDVKGPSGKTIDELQKEFDTISTAIGEKKASLEKQMQTLLHPPEYTQEERQKILKERADMANAAAQEKPKDLTAFANPELDKIRSQLQNTTLKGGEKASIDDGTGGEGTGKPSGPNKVDPKA